MIRFSCPCGHRFARPNDNAGMVVVCPDCGVVNEIVRKPPAENLRARAIQSALAINGRDDATETPAITSPPKNIAEILAALTDAPNIAVMFFVLIAHLLLAAGALAMTINLYMIAPILLALAIATLAHWANVLDDVGVEERDELPRLFRDLQLREDFIAPFFGIATALAFCYGPAVAVLFTHYLSASNTLSVAIALGLVGTFFFPALLLTLVTSGSPSNLRPGRLLGVIDGSGQRYLSVVLTFALAVIPYGCGVAALTLRIMHWSGQDISLPNWTMSPGLSIPVLGIGIFMMHAFCWHLGLLYRSQNDSFPWVGRVHVREIQKPIVRKWPGYVDSEPLQIESTELTSPTPSDVRNNP